MNFYLKFFAIIILLKYSIIFGLLWLRAESESIQRGIWKD